MSIYAVTFAPERAQYCVERADGMRIYPQTMPYSDPDARKRAATLCETLNRMEHPTWHPSVEGSPEDAPDDPTQADVVRELRKGEV